MDVSRYIKEIEQKSNKYDRREGSLQAVIDYSLECDIEAGPIEDDMKPKTSRCELCSPVPIVCFIVIGILLAIGGLLLYSRIKNHV